MILQKAQPDVITKSLILESIFWARMLAYPSLWGGYVWDLVSAVTLYLGKPISSEIGLILTIEANRFQIICINFTTIRPFVQTLELPPCCACENNSKFSNFPNFPMVMSILFVLLLGWFNQKPICKLCASYRGSGKE